MVRHNLYTIHFNVIGDNAYDLHMKTGEWGKYFDEYYDTIAERIKMMDGYPIMALDEIGQIAKIKEISSKNINAADGLNLVLNDFKLLNSMNSQIADYALANTDLYMLDVITEFIRYLDKNIWLNTLAKK